MHGVAAMATPAATPNMEDVVTVLGRFPDGATLDEIENAMTPAAARRTLQYWLSLLAEQRRVLATGEGRAARFRCAVSVPTLSHAELAGVPGALEAASIPQTPQNAGVSSQPAPAVSAAAPAARPVSQPGTSTQARTAAPDGHGIAQGQASGTASAGAAGAAPRSQFDELMDVSLVEVVLGLMPRLSVAAFLHSKGLHFLRTPEERRAFVAYGVARVGSFTMADAERYGITSEQYNAWREQYGALDVAQSR